MDGTYNLNLNEFICKKIFKRESESFKDYSSQLESPQYLPIKINSNIDSLIQRAKKEFDENVNSHDLKVLNYKGYGKEQIKNFQCSPDAFVQIIIQLAYFKLFCTISNVLEESLVWQKYKIF